MALLPGGTTPPMSPATRGGSTPKRARRISFTAAGGSSSSSSSSSRSSSPHGGRSVGGSADGDLAFGGVSPRSPHGSNIIRAQASPLSAASKKSKSGDADESPRATSLVPASPSTQHDRFIPNRRSMDYSVSHHYLTAEADENDLATPVAPTSAQTEFNSALRAALLSSPAFPNADALSSALARSPAGESASSSFSAAEGSGSPRSRITGSRVLSFHERDTDLDERDPLSPLASGTSLAALDSDTMRPSSTRAKLNRQIPSAPTRILDAPDIVDDYYLNLISWSDSNLLAVALGPSVYTWNADTNSVQLLCQLDNGDIVTSVSWMPKATGRTDCLAVGCNSSIVQLWDATSLKLIRTMTGHSARVASLSWNPSHRHVISSGGRDSIILNHDVRAPEHAVSTLVGHRQEVCGLRWSLDGTTLASGGNENFLCLWESAMGSRSNPAGEVSPRLVLNDHNAAVKALAWAPFQRSLLASGGGTADRTIKFWNIHTGTLMNSVDTGSQVCALLWSPHHKELVSSHGFSQNQLVLWKYPTMTKLKEFTGHTARVLHLDQSPDGSSVVSAAADETLRFWDIFGRPSRSKNQSSHLFGGDSGPLNMMTIR